MTGQDLYAMYAEEMGAFGQRPEQWWHIPQNTRTAFDRLATELDRRTAERVEAAKIF